MCYKSWFFNDYINRVRKCMNCFSNVTNKVVKYFNTNCIFLSFT